MIELKNAHDVVLELHIVVDVTIEFIPKTPAQLKP
jgi:hypothetical protein